MSSSKVFIIGKRSNLSRQLAKRIQDSLLIASDELHELPMRFAEAGTCDVIYNVCYKSALLGSRDAPVVYAQYAFGKLAEFVSLCLQCRENIGTVIFTSSSAVYGNNGRAAESDKTDVTNLYASLKLASEYFLSEHFRNTQIRLLIARVFNMYGGDDEFSVVSKIARAIAEGAEFSVANHGRSIRDFVHIDDVVEIYHRLLRSTYHGVVNVGTGKGGAVASVIEKAEVAYARNLRVNHVLHNEIERSVACTDNLIRQVGNIEFRSVDSYYCEIGLTNR